MAKGRKGRRHWRRIAVIALYVALLLGALPGLLVALLSGQPAIALIAVPVTMVATVIASPFVILALLVGLLGMAVPLAILAAVVGGPLYLMYRLAVRGRRHGGWSEGELGDDLPADALLRRRYVAGELTYTQFQSGMVDVLKERVTRGELALLEYEAELEKLLQPARHFDIARDPQLAGARHPR